MDKHSSLLRIFVNYGHKMFRNIGPRAQCYKTFYGCNLRIFLISHSVCPWQAFESYSSKHCNLIRTFVNYGLMENVQQVITPIVAKHIHENIFYIYVNFLSHFSIKIVSQKMVILSSLSQKLVSGFFPTVSFMTDAKILLSATLPHLHSLFLFLSCCLPVSPSFRLSINITRVGILDY